MQILFNSSKYIDFISRNKFIIPFLLNSDDQTNCSPIYLSGHISNHKYRLFDYFTKRAILQNGHSFNTNISFSSVDKQLKKTKDKLKKKTIYIEIRNLHDSSDYKNIFLSNNFVFKDHYNYIVDTTDFDIMKSRINNSKLRQIRKSLRNGAIIKQDITSNDIYQFYSILQHLYKTKVKKPLFPLSYFQELYKTSFCKFLLIEYKNKIVGGIVLLFDEVTVYEHYVCGEDKKYKDIHPSVLATWAGLDYAAKNGFKQFDFMGAGTPDKKYGVRDFKSHFGGDLVNYGRFIKINKPIMYKIGKIGLFIKGLLDKYIYLFRLKFNLDSKKGY